MKITLALTAGLFCAATLARADEAKWLGVPTPEERQAAREKAKATFPELGLGPLPLAGPGRSDYPDIKGTLIHRYIRDIVEFSEQSRRDGTILWGRICGTKAQHDTAAYMQKKFGEFGLQKVHAENFTRNAQWWPTKSRVAVMLQGAGGKSEYVLSSAFPAAPSRSTPPEGVEAEVVDVGLGRPADLAGRDLRGKIAILRSLPYLGTIYLMYSGQTLPAKLVKMGAVGVITIIDAPGNAQTFPYDAWGDTAPAYVLGSDDGNFLQDLAGRAEPGKLRVRMELESEYKPRTSTENIFGLLPGTSDEYVLIMAHQDGYFDAAIDNASGLGTMLNLAEYYARASKKKKPRRNILFLATAGHHMALGFQRAPQQVDGYPGSASPGTEDFLAKHPELVKKIVVALNCEHTASIATQMGGDVSMAATGNYFQQELNTENARTLAISNQSPMLLDYFRQAIDRYGLVVAKSTRHVPYGDAGVLQNLMPTVNLIETLDWYHTTADTPDRITPAGLERTARAFAFFLDKVEGTSRADLEKGAKPMTGVNTFAK